VGLVEVVQGPQGAGGSHGEGTGVRPNKALELPTLVMAQASGGVTVPNGDFHGPAVAILPPEVFHAEGQVRGEEGLDRGARLVPARRLATAGRGMIDSDQVYHSTREDSVPEADPGLPLGFCFLRMRLPDATFAGQRLGGAMQLVVLAGLLRFQIEFQTNRERYGVTWPQPQREAHDAEHKVQAPQGPIFPARRAGPVALACHPFDLPASWFLGGVGKLEDDRGLGRDLLGRVANEAPTRARAYGRRGSPGRHRTARSSSTQPLRSGTDRW
jgi:hypothetical protein